MKFYITDLSLFVLIIFYLPFVLLVLWRVLRKPLPFSRKIGMAALIVVIAYAIPLGDVTINSIAMAKVCPSAGLHIYKTVEVEGYIDSGGEITLRESPFTYVESPTLRAGGTYYWKRYEKNSDGSISLNELAQPTAEYEVLKGDDYARFNGFELSGYDRKTHTNKSRWLIRNRVTGEILAEWLFFRALSGWLDRALVYRWFGTGGSALSCSTDSNFAGWREKVLRPKQSKN